MESTFIGRQPIYKDGVKVFAYELFYGNQEKTRAAIDGGDMASAETLLREFVDVGVERLAGPHSAFFDVAPHFILNGYPLLLPKNGTVLQVAADTAHDTSVMNRLSQLSSMGYSIALKNYVDSRENRAVAELADIVKLNVHSGDPQTLSQRVQALHAMDVKVLAEGVETHEDYEKSRDSHFDYYEGYFFCKPQASDDRPLPSNRLSTLHLLSKLQNPDISITELEHAVGQDVAMSYRILRYLNSPINALAREVRSLRHAIALVGTGLIRQWAGVIWVQSIEEKPRELMTMAMIRAQMCQQLGAAMGYKNVDQFFTVGLLSFLDALLDKPMSTVLKDLPLVEPVKTALLAGEGDLGGALQCVQAYERCDWERTRCLNIEENRIREAYLSSVAWSRGVIQELVN